MSIFRSSYFYTYSLISPHHLKGPKQSYKYSSFKIPIKKTKSLTKELFFFLIQNKNWHKKKSYLGRNYFDGLSIKTNWI